MTQLTTFALLTLALSLSACFHEDFGPYTEASSTSSTSGTGTSDSTTSGIGTGDAEPVRSCAPPEDVPPSIPELSELAAEPEVDAATCPGTFCVSGYSCGTCCDGDAGSSGTVACCEKGSSYSPQTSSGACAPGSIPATCVEDEPDGVPSRKTPTSCNWPNAPTCPGGYHIDAPSYSCNSGSQTGQSCPSGGSCQLYCAGQYGHD